MERNVSVNKISAGIMGREIYDGSVNAFRPPLPFGKKPIPPACPIWSLLNDQYAQAEVVKQDGTTEFVDLMTETNYGVVRGYFGGYSTNMISSSYNNTIIFFNPNIGPSVYFSFFDIMNYAPIEKYFDKVCIYFSVSHWGGGGNFQFFLVDSYDDSASSIIAQSEMITVPSEEGSNVQKVTINVPSDASVAPVAIRCEKDYDSIYLHDVKLVSEGKRVPWKEPTIPCCPEWDVLGPGQKLEQQYVASDGSLQSSKVIGNVDSGILVGYGSYSYEYTPDGHDLAYYSYSGFSVYFFLFQTNEYAIDKYFDEICIYFSSGSSPVQGAEFQFFLLTRIGGTTEDVIGQSELITIPQSDSGVVQKVSIPVDPSATQAPIAIRCDRNYSGLYIHDARICSDGKQVDWIEPEQPIIG